MDQMRCTQEWLGEGKLRCAETALYLGLAWESSSMDCGVAIDVDSRGILQADIL
jgi:hypothetical protein